MSGTIEYRQLYNYASLFAGNDGHIYTVTDSRFVDYIQYVTLQQVQEYLCGNYATVHVIRRDGTKTIQNVHTLICEAFHARPKGYKVLQVRHLNGDSKDNRPCNLSYGTPLENWEDKILANTATIGEKNGMAKLTDDQRQEVCAMYANGCSQKKIAMHFGVTQGAVSKVIASLLYRNFVDNMTEKDIEVFSALKSGSIESRSVEKQYKLSKGAVSRILKHNRTGAFV